MRLERLPRAYGAGRVVAMEVMKSTYTVASLIRQMNVPQIYSALQTGAKDHMITLERRLAQLVEEGVVSRSEALRAANLPDVLQGAMGRG
ncbi:MAG: hypothetical protein ABIF82_02600 [Planctomycetota bacterium]